MILLVILDQFDILPGPIGDSVTVTYVPYNNILSYIMNSYWDDIIKNLLENGTCSCK